jgi:diguanylate cyclase (GGDEF)-like protein
MTHTEESGPPFHVAELPDSTSLARAERTVSAVGERILVERLHRVLDEGGLGAHSAFCDRALPYLQELVTLLSDPLHENVQPAAKETVRTLRAPSRLGGVTPRDIMAEGIGLHDRLRQEIMPHLCDNDRALVSVLSNLSQALLAMGRDALPPSEDGTHPMAAQAECLAPAQAECLDAETGLAGREHFEEQFGEEILRVQRSKRVLTLILLDVDGAGMAHGAGSDAHSAWVLPGIAAALLAQTRRMDLVARIRDREFALLLPETTHSDAAALLNRLAQGGTSPEAQEPALPFRAGIAVYPNDGKTVGELMQYAHNALHQEQQEGQP